MTHTDLVKEILLKANTIKEKYCGEHLYASHIAAAVAEFCSTKYTGFAFSKYSAPRFEDERLRYLFSKEVKVSSYFWMRLLHNKKAGVQEEEFDIAGCEAIISARNTGMLSADILFLCALKDLHPSYRPTVRSAGAEDAVLALLQDADINIYDYVIQNIEQVCTELRQKADEAAAIRDWKPKEKFAEPEELVRLAFAGIEATHSGHIMTVKIPKFFGNATLTLSIHRADGIYYIHDNRCALRCLARKVRDSKKRERIIRKVCHSHRIEGGRITGSFVDTTGFMYYLKDLVFVAQAELYYTRATRQLCFKDKGYAYIPDSNAEPFDPTSLTEMLAESVNAYYDENKGLCCWLKVGNSPFQTRYSFLVETMGDGSLRFSDRLKGNYEGELLEPCYWYHEGDDISVYSRFLCKLAGNFGGEFDGKNIYLTVKPKDFQRGLFGFFQLSVLVSRFGHDIALSARKPR